MFEVKKTPAESKALESKWVRGLEYFIIANWWVIMLMIVLGIFYELSMRNFKFEYAKLKTYEKDLAYQKETALYKQKDLQLQVNSQSDPTYIELTLMKGLGLVPEGYKKVYFSHDSH